MDSPMSPMHNDPFGFADGGLSTHEDVAISSTPSPGAAALAHHFEDIPPDLAKPENNQPPPPPTPDEKAPSVPDESCVLASPEEDQGGMMGWLRYSTSPAVAAQKRCGDLFVLFQLQIIVCERESVSDNKRNAFEMLFPRVQFRSSGRNQPRGILKQ